MQPYKRSIWKQNEVINTDTRTFSTYVAMNMFNTFAAILCAMAMMGNSEKLDRPAKIVVFGSTKVFSTTAMFEITTIFRNETMRSAEAITQNSSRGSMSFKIPKARACGDVRQNVTLLYIKGGEASERCSLPSLDINSGIETSKAYQYCAHMYYRPPEELCSGWWVFSSCQTSYSCKVASNIRVSFISSKGKYMMLLRPLGFRFCGLLPKKEVAEMRATYGARA